MSALERRFTDDEMRRIFEDAARAEARPTAPPAAQGHTLAELHDIARQVGISGTDIDRAVANLDAPPATIEVPSARFLGFALTLHEERMLRRALSDSELSLLTRQVERVANRPGFTQLEGNWAEWQDRKERLYVGIVRGRGTTHVRIIADHSREFMAGAGAIGLFGVYYALQAAGLPTPTSGSGLAALLIAGATYGVIRLFWEWRTRIARGHMQDLLDILEDSLPAQQDSSNL
jgi:hypothetical protein